MHNDSYSATFCIVNPKKHSDAVAMFTSPQARFQVDPLAVQKSLKSDNMVEG